MKLPAKPPKLETLFSEIPLDKQFPFFTQELIPGKYLHWDEMRRRPAPDGLNHREWWLKTKLARRLIRRKTPLMDTEGTAFSYCLTDEILEKLPKIDARAKGLISFGEQIINTNQRNRYVISSLIEEAITSSQLEGAATTRKVASEMLRSGRPPRDKSERMILNNYLAMQKIIEIKDEPFSGEVICKLHKIVTEHTLESTDSAGKLQTPEEERVQIWDDIDNQILHTPPPAESLPGRMHMMCDFANTSDNEPFLHPVIKAILLHFWLAYDHPFEDGNGRTARALFYWAMLKQGYWLFEFVSISSLLRKAPARYAKSFLYTETDDNDLTYFILYQLDIILRAIDALEEYIGRKTSEVKDLDQQIKNAQRLNHREKALLAHALKKPDQVYSIASHQRSHHVAYATSRSDLLHLKKLELLQEFKVGKALRYKAMSDLSSRLQKLD